MLYERNGNLVIMPVWNDKLLRRSKHFCGRAHASRYVERWIANPAMDSADAASDLLTENEQAMQVTEQAMRVPMQPAPMQPAPIHLAPVMPAGVPQPAPRTANTLIARFPHAHDPWIEDEAELMAARASVRYA
jgi:hypothetical protein